MTGSRNDTDLNVTPDSQQAQLQEHTDKRTGKKPRKRYTWFPGKISIVSSIVAVLIVGALVAVPMPFVIDKPGPTFNVLGGHNGISMIDISGTDPVSGQDVAVDDTNTAEHGELRMVTVSESGGPGRRVNLIELVSAMLNPTNDIVPYDKVYPATATKEQVEQASQALMQSSQSSAQVAALEHLGWDVPATVTVAGATPGSDADGKVREGDVLTAITTEDGQKHPVNSMSTPFALMRQIPVGSKLTVTVKRNGEEVDIPIVSSAPSSSQEEGSKLGLYLTGDIKLPLNIAIHLEKVGGSSAGLMFSLGIIDRLTEGSLTSGAKVAGTGTISYDGQVGPIGGIRQKMWGAKRDGAQWFFAPSSNCDEVVGHVPDGLRVVEVTSLKDALNALDAIKNGTTDTLPSCQSQ